MKILTAPRMDRCTGCHACSLACARLAHGLHSWLHAGVRVRLSGGHDGGFAADICTACDPAPCAAACPEKALAQRETGGVKLHKALCSGCGECAKACPAQAIYIDGSGGVPFFCIHCGRCVPFCPCNCLELADNPHAGEQKGAA